MLLLRPAFDVAVMLVPVGQMLRVHFRVTELEELGRDIGAGALLRQTSTVDDLGKGQSVLSMNDSGRRVIGCPGKDRDPLALNPELDELLGLPTDRRARVGDRDPGEVDGESTIGNSGRLALS